MELCLGEQQRQIEALEAHLSKYIEDKFAEKRLGTYILHSCWQASLSQNKIDSAFALHSGHFKTQ